MTDEELRKKIGLKDAIETTIPVRSTDGAMRSLVNEYDRKFSESPEGFGHIMYDRDSLEEENWFVRYYQQDMAVHMFKNSTMDQTDDGMRIAYDVPEEYYRRLLPLNPLELITSAPNTELNIDRPYPDLLQDLLKGNKEARRKAFRYIMKERERYSKKDSEKSEK